MPEVKTQSKDGDPRVAAALDDLGVNYEIDANGDFRLGFRLDEGRTQLGFIRSATYDFGEQEMREIFSAGLSSLGPFDARTANLLLAMNSNVKIGAWSIERDAEDNHWAVFRAHVPADLVGKPLMNVIQAVLTAADDIEERLSGRDDF